jgi:hypothetical protein
MAKTKISEYSATSADNTDISNINIAEGCSPANVNNAIRTVMAQLKDLQAGTSGDTIPIAAGGTGSATAATARSALSAAKSGANSDITSITGLTTPLTVAQGGTGTASTTFANLTTNVTGTLPVANGGTGLATLTANNVMLGNGTSAPSFVAPSTSGNVLTSNGTTWTSAASNTLTSGTVQATTSGTSIDFTSIPSSVKRITVILNGVSTNGSNRLIIQIGAGSITSTGYTSAAMVANNTSSTGLDTFTTGFGMDAGVPSSTTVRYGVMTIVNMTGNTWAYTYSGYMDVYGYVGTASGIVTLSGTLDRIRLTSVNSTNTFDAGSINILYE